MVMQLSRVINKIRPNIGIKKWEATICGNMQVADLGCINQQDYIITINGEKMRQLCATEGINVNKIRPSIYNKEKNMCGKLCAEISENKEKDRLST